MQAQEQHFQVFGVAEFSAVPQTDPCQRALYHFLSWGYIYTFLPAHINRNNGEPYSDHQVEQFIKDKFYPDSSNVMTDGDRTIFDIGERCEHIRQ